MALIIWTLISLTIGCVVGLVSRKGNTEGSKG